MVTENQTPLQIILDFKNRYFVGESEERCSIVRSRFFEVVVYGTKYPRMDQVKFLEDSL